MNDEELWKKYTQSVKPASWAKKPVFPELHPERAKAPHATETRAILKSVQNSYISSPKKTSQHENKNAEKNLAKQMRRGLFQYQAKIDLHGYSQDQAYDALYDFFERNYRAQKRYLLVITGKGKFCYDTYRNKG
ncbi:MAG: Smr/MutS family protein, partial [Pseudomonadota bacterium]